MDGRWTPLVGPTRAPNTWQSESWHRHGRPGSQPDTDVRRPSARARARGRPDG
jgi:hypothetical protein